MTSRTRLLLVEDDRDIREAVTEIFKDKGYDVTATANGVEALAELRASPLPTVVLLDLWMPIMDGWQFHAAMQKVPAFAEIPVITMSAEDQTHAEDRILSAGHVRKPVDVDQLIELVDRVSARTMPPLRSGA